MSVIEDTRKLLQDFLAPELRELTAHIDALEQRMDARFDALEQKTDARFDALQQRTDARFDASERLASERHAQTMQAITRLADVYELRERITRIEAREKAS
jgi:outer membrane murein-binding lipoprotein Lpp